MLRKLNMDIFHIKFNNKIFADQRTNTIFYYGNR
jgi:hypothetical protein